MDLSSVKLTDVEMRALVPMHGSEALPPELINMVKCVKHAYSQLTNNSLEPRELSVVVGVWRSMEMPSFVIGADVSAADAEAIQNAEDGEIVPVTNVAAITPEETLLKAVAEAPPNGDGEEEDADDGEGGSYGRVTDWGTIKKDTRVMAENVMHEGENKGLVTGTFLGRAKGNSIRLHAPRINGKKWIEVPADNCMAMQ